MNDSKSDVEPCSVCGEAPVAGSYCSGCAWQIAPEADRGPAALDWEIPEPHAPLCDRVLAQAPRVGFGPVKDRLRSLDTQPQRQFKQAGYHANTVGLSVKSARSYQRKRKHVEHTDLYDYLLFDAVVCTMAFYQAMHGFSIGERDAFVEGAVDGDIGMGPPKNMARTYRWLKDKDIATPRELARKYGAEVVTIPPRKPVRLADDGAERDNTAGAVSGSTSPAQTTLSDGGTDESESQQSPTNDAEQSGLGEW
jgi:hypothetical protein